MNICYLDCDVHAICAALLLGDRASLLKKAALKHSSHVVLDISNRIVPIGLYVDQVCHERLQLSIHTLDRDLHQRGALFEPGRHGVETGSEKHRACKSGHSLSSQAAAMQEPASSSHGIESCCFELSGGGAECTRSSG